MGWEGARGLSQQLVPPRFEQAYVSSLIYGWDGEYFWTALQDINETGAFRWLSGDEVMYTHWNRDQPGKGTAVVVGGMGMSPSLLALPPGRGPAVTLRLAPGYNKGGCVALATGSSMGLWEVKNCSTFKAKYICRQNLGTPVNPELPNPYPTPSLTGACPPGWSADPKLRHCYKVRGAGGGGEPWPCPPVLGACTGAWVHAKGSPDPTAGWLGAGSTGGGVSGCGPWAEPPCSSPRQVFNFDKLQEKKTWIAAQEFCRELGAQLLSLGSYEEEHFIANTLNKIFG